MRPDTCSFCKGKTVEGEAEFMVKVEDRVLVITNVPAYICEECGEAYYTPETSEKLDRIMRKYHESTLPQHPIAAGQLSLKEAEELSQTKLPV